MDHIRATCLISDIVLMPELSTWSSTVGQREGAAKGDLWHVHCDGSLLTSPGTCQGSWASCRMPASPALCFHLWFFAFLVYLKLSIPKTISISTASALLNNHDQPFIQELVDGLYHTGANVEIFLTGQMEICSAWVASVQLIMRLPQSLSKKWQKYNYITQLFHRDWIL